MPRCPKCPERPLTRVAHDGLPGLGPAPLRCGGIWLSARAFEGLRETGLLEQVDSTDTSSCAVRSTTSPTISQVARTPAWRLRTCVNGCLPGRPRGAMTTSEGSVPAPSLDSSSG